MSTLHTTQTPKNTACQRWSFLTNKDETSYCLLSYRLLESSYCKIKHTRQYMKTLSHSRGFTLIELMIVVAIIGILAAIAIPAFSEYLKKSRRTDAQAAVSAVQQAQERWRANNTSYTSSFTDLSIAGGGTCTVGAATGILSDENYYCMTLSGNSGTGYIVTATARGKQSGDTDCGALVLTVTNGNAARSSTKSGGGASVGKCW